MLVELEHAVDIVLGAVPASRDLCSAGMVGDGYTRSKINIRFANVAVKCSFEKLIGRGILYPKPH